MRQDTAQIDLGPSLGEFFSDIDISILFQMFDHIGDTCFFIKDASGRLLAANSQLIRMYGLSSKQDILGKTDFYFVPHSLAEKYKNDDIKILETKQPMLNILELAYNSVGISSWSITNKIPLINKDNCVIGIMGTISKRDNVQLINNAESNDSVFYNVLKYIDSHFQDDLILNKIAREFGLSCRSIERYFKEHLNITPVQFIIKTRILKACDRLIMGMNISKVATECGFYDQSSFTKQFKKHMNLTPMQYIREFNLTQT
jgi:AraC-like DNA-binding protein